MFVTAMVDYCFGNPQCREAAAELLQVAEQELLRRFRPERSQRKTGHFTDRGSLTTSETDSHGCS